jgi:hypothetical protein
MSRGLQKKPEDTDAALAGTAPGLTYLVLQVSIPRMKAKRRSYSSRLGR